MQITETILAGNCGDATETEIERYANLVEAAFKRMFPTAEITVNVTDETGCGPETSVEFDDDEDYDDHMVFFAQQVSRNVWDAGKWHD